MIRLLVLLACCASVAIQGNAQRGIEYVFPAEVQAELERWAKKEKPKNLHLTQRGDTIVLYFIKESYFSRQSNRYSLISGDTIPITTNLDYDLGITGRNYVQRLNTTLYSKISLILDWPPYVSFTIGFNGRLIHRFDDPE